MRYAILLGPVLGLLALAACGGGGEEVEPTPTPSPAVAQPSPTPTPTTTPSPTPEPTATPAPLRILFTSDREPMGKYLMDADGSNVVRIGSMLGGLEVDIWSPDGSKVAFVKCLEAPSNDSELHVANADGSGEVNVSNHPSPDIERCGTDACCGGFDWSPDGTRLVFYSFRDPGGLYVVIADGSGLAFLADGFQPSWSPDGESIAFMGRSDLASLEDDLEVIKADGSDRRVLARIPCLWSGFGGSCGWSFFRRISWSPDGAYIVFAATPSSANPEPPDFNFNSEVYTLRNDGTGLTKITYSPSGGSGHPRWVDCSRPTAGCQARVTNVGPERLNVRKAPVGTGVEGFASVVGKLREGDVVCFIGPPRYSDGFKWWPLHAVDGTEGWAAAFDPGEVNRPWLTATGETCEGEPAG